MVNTLIMIPSEVTITALRYRKLFIRGIFDHQLKIRKLHLKKEGSENKARDRAGANFRLRKMRG